MNLLAPYPLAQKVSEFVLVRNWTRPLKMVEQDLIIITLLNQKKRLSSLVVNSKKFMVAKLLKEHLN